jgi:hypothetical protein
MVLRSGVSMAGGFGCVQTPILIFKIPAGKQIVNNKKNYYGVRGVRGRHAMLVENMCVFIADYGNQRSALQRY